MTELTINHVDVAKLAVKPGEFLLIKAQGIITVEQAQRIRDAFHAAFERYGINIPAALVIDDTLTVEIVKREDA